MQSIKQPYFGYSYTQSFAQSQSGFTLIELMISIVLGLLISAAVVQIYITNVRTSTIQKSASELQDTSVFGLQFLESHIRLANLGNPNPRIDDTTTGGGIVLTPANISPSSTANTVYLSRTAGDTPLGSSTDNGWTGISNTNIGSDQLTIQFTNKTGVDMVDCEGSTLPNNAMVIERYFLRPSSLDTSTSTTGVRKLVLACDAGRVDATGVQVITPSSDPKNFGQAGQEFINSIDQFKVLLGIESVDGSTLQYLSVHDYNTLATKLPIVAVKIGVIAHGNTPIVSGNDITTFTVLGTTNNLKTDSSRSKQVRTTYESTTMLRNARVITVTSATAATL